MIILILKYIFGMAIAFFGLNVLTYLDAKYDTREEERIRYDK